jgi:hypothetical protein
MSELSNYTEQSSFEKLIDSDLVKKFPTLCGSRRFIRMFTGASHWTVSRTTKILSTPPTSLRSVLILFSYLSLLLPSGLCSSGFPTSILYVPVTCITHLNLLDLITLILFASRSSLVSSFLHFPVMSSFLGPNIVRGPFENFVDWRQCATVMLLCLPLHKSSALQTALVVAPPPRKEFF